jgi:AcrR family transcriptional regulator
MGALMEESRKEREFRLREEDILSCALALFEAEGIDNVTVAQIAKATDIGKGTIYKHFASKDEIFARISLDFNDMMFIKTLKLTSEGSCYERLKTMFEICFSKHLEFPLIGEISLRCELPDFTDNLSEPLQQACIKQQQDYYGLLFDIIGQGVEQGVLIDMPLEELLCGAHATFTGALQMLRNRSRKCFDHTDELSESRFIELIIQYTMAGLFGLGNDKSASILPKEDL